ncbi:probable leucine--tRNA ligase, mitochondrial [Sinocyclocheilus grahami]|uniref:probable leucine--tRNA ligase, mitochondrial n=1 Tax=Sinocyclocheilus grahami TaxID=75366 RepID=UPI0007AC7064|nr:PREDICTED: probable leucine--tRNA ligase, mitochondrial [Sinocyclocheilus grahami]
MVVTQERCCLLHLFSRGCVRSGLSLSPALPPAVACSSALKTALLRALRPGRDSLTEVTALNVFTGCEVLVVIFGKNEFNGHLDTVIGIPESSEEDAELARSLDLSWNSVLKTERRL